MNEDKLFLSNDELRLIEQSESKTIIASLNAEILKLRQQIIQLKAKNYEVISQLKKYEIDQKSDDVNKLKASHKKLMDSLKSKYGITSDRWGYDPISGELIS